MSSLRHYGRQGIRARKEATAPIAVPRHGYQNVVRVRHRQRYCHRRRRAMVRRGGDDVCEKTAICAIHATPRHAQKTSRLRAPASPLAGAPRVVLLLVVASAPVAHAMLAHVRYHCRYATISPRPLMCCYDDMPRRSVAQ